MFTIRGISDLKRISSAGFSSLLIAGSSHEGLTNTRMTLLFTMSVFCNHFTKSPNDTLNIFTSTDY